MNFKFDEFITHIDINSEIPSIQKIFADLSNTVNAIIVCDENTSVIADKICGNYTIPRCIIKSGEASKTWESVQTILTVAYNSGLGRDSVFIAAGGGVICDITGFAASIYKRGCRLVYVPTTLLAMVDASVGGKTGFNLFSVKNLTGSFYPAEFIYMPLECLSSLPADEWKNGIAELIKTAILSGDDFLDMITEGFSAGNPEGVFLQDCIKRAVWYKGNIVSGDFRETSIKNDKNRMLLNLGHTFAHALEAFSNYNISHGEAVTWGIVRACELGLALEITPYERAQKIIKVINSFGFISTNPHPSVNPEQFSASFFNFLDNDKKKRQNKLIFIVPDKTSALPVIIDTKSKEDILKKII